MRLSPAAEIQFCFLLSVIMGMGVFWSWKWQEWCMSEKSVLYYRRPCLSSASVTKCSSHSAVIRNLFWSADFLLSRKRKRSAHSTRIPEWLREDKKYCGCFFIPAKSVCKQVNCVQTSWGVNVRGKRACLTKTIWLLEQVTLNWPSTSYSWKWEVSKHWELFFWNSFPLVEWERTTQVVLKWFVVSPVAHDWI